MGKQYGILKRILNNLESSTLPTATPQDKDKVATVDESGAWQAKQPSGGSGNGPLIVTATFEYDSGTESATLDKTYNEIKAAMLTTGAYILEEAPDESHELYNVGKIKSFGAGDISGETVYFVLTQFNSVDLAFTSSSADGVLSYSSDDPTRDFVFSLLENQNGILE